MTYDVIIVGAGPSGSFAATRLAKQGLRVLVLEEHAEVGRPRHCTGILGQEAYTRFPELPREPIHSSLQDAWIVSPNGERARAPWFNSQAFIIDRSKFDQSLAAGAVSAGAELRTSCRVNGIHISEMGAEAAIENMISGKENVVQAPAIVIASGVSARFHAMLGLQPPSSLLQCAQVEADGDRFDTAEVYIGKDVAPGSFAWAVPVGNGKVRVGVTAHRMAETHLRKLLGGLLLSGRLTFDPARIVRRPVPIRPVACSVADRVLLVGDAAGQVKPTTGGGIYYGLIGAELAANTLVKAQQQNNFSRNFLMRYDREWRSALRTELRMASLARRCFEWFSDEQLDRLVKACRDPKVSTMIQQGASFDWHAKLALAFISSPRIVWQLL